jgi:hypothetical protein
MDSIWEGAARFRDGICRRTTLASPDTGPRQGVGITPDPATDEARATSDALFQPCRQVVEPLLHGACRWSAR